MISPPDTFTVLDVETTGLDAGTDLIIEIAAIKYVRGRESAVFEALVNPHRALDGEITRLTGITDSDLAGAKSIEAVLPGLIEFLGNEPVVAHNASFDSSFLSAACAKQGLAFKNRTIDTLMLARDAFPEFERYSLGYLKKRLDINVEASHRALPDVRATAALYFLCIDRLRQMGRERPRPHGSLYENSKIKASEIQPAQKADENHPLFGKSIVFTGELSISRRDAMQMAVNAGALIKTGVSKKTDYLVAGQQDAALVGENGLSAKEKAAHTLNREGKADIRILKEDEYIALAANEVLLESE